MYVIIARFECICSPGLPREKAKRVVYGLLSSLRKQLKCSVIRVDDHDDALRFAVGMSLVADHHKIDMESEFSQATVDFIERRGEVIVQDYVCTLVNMDDLMDSEDLVTLH